MVVALGGSDCERIGPGWLAQPANAVSSLAYVAVGAWLLRRSSAPALRRPALLAGGGAMIAVGIGSFAYHGPQPGWARSAHDGSVLALAAVLIADTVAAGARRRTATAASTAAWRASAAWLAGGLVAYGAGRTGSPLCRPATLWQPHAAWHASSAAGLGLAVLGCAARSLRPSPERMSPGRDGS